MSYTLKEYLGPHYKQIVRGAGTTVTHFICHLSKKQPRIELYYPKSKLSQSDFIRNFIKDFNINDSSKNDIIDLLNTISENINDITRLKNQLHYLGYLREEELLQKNN